MAGSVIRWNDAMEQCGGDEEFLRELLVDLNVEADTQLTAISGLVQVRLRMNISRRTTDACLLACLLAWNTFGVVSDCWEGKNNFVPYIISLFFQHHHLHRHSRIQVLTHLNKLCGVPIYSRVRQAI